MTWRPFHSGTQILPGNRSTTQLGPCPNRRDRHARTSENYNIIRFSFQQRYTISNRLG